MFREHVGQFFFFLSHFFEFFDVVSAFPKIKKSLHDWGTNVIDYFAQFYSPNLNIFMVNNDAFITLLKCADMSLYAFLRGFTLI